MTISAPFSFLGAGDILLDILADDGSSTGLQVKGDSPDFTFKTDADVKQQTKHGRDNYGQVGASASLPKPATLAFTMNEVDAELFAAAMYGTSSALTQSSGTLTDQPVTTKADRYVEIGKRMLSDVVVKNTAGTTTYVLGTDYLINPRLGLIMALSTGAITAGMSVKISGSYAAINGTTIAAMTKSQVLARVMVDGVEFSSRRDFIFDAPRVRLTVNGDIPVKGDNFAQVKFTGTMETPAGFDAPFVFDWLS